MKSAVMIYNQCITVRTYAESHFRFIFRPASFTWSWCSQEALQLRPLHCHSSAPLSFCHSRVFSGLANARLLCPMVGSPSRFMGSHPPPQSSQEVVSLTDKEKLTLVKAEYELYKTEGEVEVPSQMREQDLLELTQLRSIMARKKYLRYLFLNEMKAFNIKQKQQQKKIFAEEKYKRLNEEINLEDRLLSYGLWRNSMFIRWSNHHMNTIDSHRLIQAKLYGQPIVFDYDFDQHMTSREKKILGRQISRSIGLNRSNREPFYVHLCNFKREDGIGQATMKALPTLFNDDFLIDVHSEDYLDIFPKDRLVYLTPDCREEMKNFDHDAIYIIGGLIDLGSSIPTTLTKAKKQNIKMQKLPLDRYLDWGRGKKTLTLNQVLGILLDVKRSGSWVQALTKHIPPRNLVKAQDVDAAAIKERMQRSEYKDKKASWRLVKTLFKD